MDGHRFDELTRTFARRISRRTTLKATGALVLGKLLPAQGVAAQRSCEAVPACYSQNATCFTAQEVDGTCTCLVETESPLCDFDTCSSNSDCGDRRACVFADCSDGLGRCAPKCAGWPDLPPCDAGWIECDGACFDPRVSNQHCGMCGIQCEMGGGESVGKYCRDGICQCPEDATPTCGQDYCASEQNDPRNCGSCGNVCPTGTRCCGGGCLLCSDNSVCCGGRCLDRTSGERFCDWCGYLGGFPQGCLSYETCDRGLCVPMEGTFEHAVVVVTCPTQPYIPEGPQTSDPAVIVSVYVANGCQADEGTTVEARGSDGQLVDSCVTAAGFCSVTIDSVDLPATLTPVGVHADVLADDPITIEGWIADGGAISHLINIAVGADSASAPEATETSSPTSDLAYAIKNGEHWDIWAYSFDTKQNTQLASVPESDQWAPAYAHDGSQIAYLSDHADGSNQIWLMHPDGSNQRQVSSWYGSESIQYVAWSPDDSQLIVTLNSDAGRRLAVMGAGGGDLASLVPVSSSFATTAPGGAMLYTSEIGGSTSFFFAYFDNLSNAAIFDLGDTPNISYDGHYGVVQLGDPGGRHIVTYGLVMDSPPLPVVPSVGDDSNPIWLTTRNDTIAFVSSNAGGESIQVCQLGSGVTAPIAIAPHERVWYLAKRFPASDVPVSTGGGLPVTSPDQTGEDDASSGGSVSNGSGPGSLEVHIVECPVGYTGPDWYETCHDNGDDARQFLIQGQGIREILQPVIEEWPGPAIVRLGGLAPGDYEITLMTKFVKAPAFVFCSPDEGETVLVEQQLGDFDGFVSVPVYGQNVVCDWYQITY